MKFFKKRWKNIKNVPGKMKVAGQAVWGFSKEYPATVAVSATNVVGAIALYAFASSLSRPAFALATTGLALGVLVALPLVGLYGYALKNEKRDVIQRDRDREGGMIIDGKGYVVTTKRPLTRIEALRDAGEKYVDVLPMVGDAVVEFGSACGKSCLNNKSKIAGAIGVIGIGIAAHKLAHSSFDVLLKGSVSALDVTKYAACAVTVGSALYLVYSQFAANKSTSPSSSIAL